MIIAIFLPVLKHHFQGCHETPYQSQPFLCLSAHCSVARFWFALTCSITLLRWEFFSHVGRRTSPQSRGLKAARVFRADLAGRRLLVLMAPHRRLATRTGACAPQNPSRLGAARRQSHPPRATSGPGGDGRCRCAGRR